MTPITSDDVLGVILAGGQGRRMGFVDKPLITIRDGADGDGTILEHILDRVMPQVGRVIINANTAEDQYARYCDDVIPDSVDGYLGPLSGVLTAMDWAAMHSGYTHILTLPGDAPFIPRDLAQQMIAAYNAMAEDGLKLVRATSNMRTHPVVGLWPVAIRAQLRDALVNDDMRKIDAFTASFPLVDVDFAGVPDPFFNINTDDDVETARRILAGGVTA